MTRAPGRRSRSARRLAAPASFLAGILGIPLALGGCKTIDGTTGIPPFWEVYDSPSSVVGGEGEETFFRPFGSYEALKPESSHLRFFTPFLDFRWGPEGERYWALPLFFYRRFPQPLAGDDVDWMLLPFFLGGSDPDEGSYFAFFPLAGNIKGLLAKDDIRFFLFPLYWQATDREKESLHILWPFYNEVWGGDWTGGRLWPFYGRYRSFEEGGQLRYDRTFCLWPFYLHRDDQMHLSPTELVFYFPFYGYRGNQQVETSTYLWPFFQTTHEKRYDRTSVMGYIIPYRVTEGQTDIWPFFGVKKTSRALAGTLIAHRTYRQFCLWPIQRYDWGTDGLGESTRFWLLPLYWHFHYIDNDTLETRSESKFWPLLRYRRSGEELAVDFLSPLWIGREDYERYYSRWFGIIRYRWREAIGGWEVLYGVLMYRREEATKEKLFSVLGGLLELGTREGEFAMKLLYVRLW